MALLNIVARAFSVRPHNHSQYVAVSKTNSKAPKTTHHTRYTNLVAREVGVVRRVDEVMGKRVRQIRI